MSTAGHPGPGGHQPVPEGFRLVLDRQVQRRRGGSVLIGGAPLTVLRLTPAGARLVDDLAAGGPVPTSGAANRLARRLLDRGLAHPRPCPAPARPAVTAVVPVRDDPAGLAATLAHLGPVADVVVVDDGSAEPAAVRRVAAAAGPCQVIRLEPSQGPAAARQAGWTAASSDVIAFVDADCEPQPGWLDVLLAHLADPAVAAAAPRVVAAAPPGTPPWLAAYEAVRSPLDLGPVEGVVRPRSRVPYVPTAALVVRRSALVAAGGFDLDLRTGEDVDLVWRLVAAGWTVRYDPAATARHPVRPGLAPLLRQRFAYGTSAAPLAARHGPAAAPLTTSCWTAAAWALVVAGHPVPAGWVAVATTAALVPRLGSLPRPWLEAAALAGTGHLGAGRLVVQACRRSWWPVVALAGLTSSRARRLAALLVVAPAVLDRRRRSLGLGPWLALRLADDVAYGAGVWTGAARARSLAALRPDLVGARFGGALNGDLMQAWASRSLLARPRRRGRPVPAP